MIQCKIIDSGVARSGPTRACALPSTFQALLSVAQYDHVIHKELNMKANTVATRLDISVCMQHLSIKLNDLRNIHAIE